VKASVGASLNNVAASQYDMFMKHLIHNANQGPTPNDRTGAVGARFDFPDFMMLSKNLVAIEWQDIGHTGHLASFWKKSHIGGETRLIKFLSVRGGINEGYFGGGVGLDFPIVKIDIATYGEELGSTAGQMGDRRYVMRFELAI
jgi:hypothetical protein